MNDRYTKPLIWIGIAVIITKIKKPLFIAYPIKINKVDHQVNCKPLSLITSPPTTKQQSRITFNSCIN